ncbi:biopolymer transporter ExbD [Kordia sp.]|uniref:ExbD/TolR family protein n=1 Tax=Kordia sp. TaxID=1965332 RepID=UPI0025C6C772|nr:biopolymer transporter ExbD [Kordia sp.]MCH2196464.1 biopolymer transporter ExbD [Kordia sp.]
MKMSRNTNSGINAGSMADIAFLLLIFFLVTTTFEEDEGISSVIPKLCPEGTDCNSEVKTKNVFKIKLNKNDQLMANNEIISLNELREEVKAFVDNNGDQSCNYCNGAKKENLSEHPTKAVIAIETDREASYDSYIGVQNELMGAYTELRTILSKTKFKKEVEDLTKEELKLLKEAYPFLITDSELK